MQSIFTCATTSPLILSHPLSLKISQKNFHEIFKKQERSTTEIHDTRLVYKFLSTFLYFYLLFFSKKIKNSALKFEEHRIQILDPLHAQPRENWSRG